MQKPWIEHYDQGVPETIEVPKDISVIDFFKDSTKKFPGHPAIIYFGKKISYSKLDELANKLGLALKGLGIEENDGVALHLPNIPQFIIAYLAILKIGAIAVPINPTYKGKDLEHIIENSGAKTVITITKFYETVVGSIKTTENQPVIIATNVKSFLPPLKKLVFTLLKERKEGHTLPAKNRDILYLEKLINKVSRKTTAAKRLPRKEIALIQYTGGTTGRPKGTILTHRNLTANILQVKSLMPDFEEAKEIAIAVLPFFHIYALSTILNLGLASAATLVLVPQPDIKEILANIKKYRATILPGVPLLYERIIEFAKENQNIKKELSSLKYCTSGAAALKQRTQSCFINLGAPMIIEGYGLTETSSVTHINPILGRKKPESIGLPVPSTEVKIIDIDTKKILGPHQVGEFIISGPQVMQGYWKNSMATNQVKKDGWLHTGDIGYMDEEGYFFLVERKKDMIEIKGSGLKVYPSEVEEVIAKHQLVKEAVVVGKQDESGGEVPVAYVVLNENVMAREKVKQSIIEACKKDLAPYKVPRTIEFVNEIPKTIIGKPLRKEFKKAPN